MTSQISAEILATLEVIKFPGKIVIIDTEEQARAAAQKILKERVVGIDTETRPSFKKGVVHRVALVQISTWKVCYLFRICHIGNIEAVKMILESTETLKIGLSLQDDFSGLRRLSPFTPHNYIELQKCVPSFGIEELSLQKIYALIFGRKISKTQQLSNWEASTLTPAQQLYAATDAWSCLHIYKALKGLRLPEEYRNMLSLPKLKDFNKRFTCK